MTKVFKKSLLVVLACVLCFLPFFAFGGCSKVTSDADMSGYDVEITNVASINGTSPYEGKVWYNPTLQRVRYYVKDDTTYYYTLQLCEVPYNTCNIKYYSQRYSKQTTN